MILSLEVRCAKKGDCLLLHYGTTEEPRLIMIDGGPSGVYEPHLRPRLMRLREARGLADDQPLEVDLLMVSHVDDDHIRGILDFTRELLEQKRDHQPRFARVHSFWHNSFGSVVGEDTDRVTASVTGQFGPASAAGELREDDVTAVELEFAGSRPGMSDDAEVELVSDTMKVLASIAQGFQLRVDAEALGFDTNPEFGGELILAARGQEPVDMDGLTFTVVGPMQEELDELRKKHRVWLEEMEEEGKELPRALAAYVDRSVANLSSLVLLAKFDEKTILLTGDARGDKILEGLELVGLLKKGESLKVGVLKVPHHGSDNNADDDLFERIIADHYVFSGDGEHGNPERATLEMLVKARGRDADYTIHLTYPIDQIDEGREADWEKERNKEKKKQQKKPSQKVRAAWDANSQSLSAFFDANDDLKAKVRIVDAEAPHLIDLGEPVEF